MKSPALISLLLLMFFHVNAQRHYAVVLKIISWDDPAEALLMAQAHEKDVSLAPVIFDIYTNSGGDPQWPYVYKYFTTAKEPFYLSEKFGDMVAHIRNPVYAQQGIEALKKLEVSCEECQDKISLVLSLIKNNRLILYNQ